MPDLPIALQLYTVRDAAKKDLDATLAQLAEIGYRHVELAGTYGLDPAELKAKLDANGLTPIAAHHPWVTGDLNEAFQTAKTLGYKYVIQPFWPADDRTAAGYRRVLDKLADVKGRAGVVFGYHNHDFEFETLDNGRTAFATLFEDTDLTCEMDTAWVAVAGLDPVAEMRKLGGRLPLVHVKDCSDFGQRTLCELGRGKVPVREVVAAAPEVGAEYLVVEQDNNWVDGDPIKSARVSYEAIRSM